MFVYWFSKKKLFIEYLNRGFKREIVIVVFNCDDFKGWELVDSLLILMIKIGLVFDCDIQVEIFCYGFVGIDGRVFIFWGGFDFKIFLVGIYNVVNIFCVVGVVIVFEIVLVVIKVGFEKLIVIFGCFECIVDFVGCYIYVDYVYILDVLENVILVLKVIVLVWIICVFGCGGDCDKFKCFLMGVIVVRLCDLFIVILDNFCMEEFGVIIDQIIFGIKQVGGVEYSV